MVGYLVQPRFSGEELGPALTRYARVNWLPMERLTLSEEWIGRGRGVRTGVREREGGGTVFGM